MTRQKFIRWRNQQRVIIAVYWLADADGLLCRATWAQLRAETGLGKETLQRHLELLEDRGIIRLAPAHDRLNRRTLVLLDHPNATDYLANLAGPVRGRPKSGRRAGTSLPSDSSVR